MQLDEKVHVQIIIKAGVPEALVLDTKSRCGSQLAGLRAQSWDQTLINLVAHCIRYLDQIPKLRERKDALKHKNIQLIFLVFKYLFQVVKAFIVLNPDQKSNDQEQLKKEIQEHVKRATAPYKYPRKVGILIMNNICLVFWKFSAVYFFHFNEHSPQTCYTKYSKLN